MADPDDPFNTLGLLGDGKTNMLVFDEHVRGVHRVIQKFEKPMAWVAYDPSNAVAVGKQFIDSAVACGAHVEIKVPKRKITEHQRLALITRVGHMLRSMMEQNKPLPNQARQVVDTILSAID